MSPDHTPPRLSMLARSLRRRLMTRLASLQGGQLIWEDRWLGEQHRLGPATGDLSAHLRIDAPAFYQALLWRGPLGVGEAFVAGHWHSPDLEQLLRLMLRNRAVIDRLEAGPARLAGGLLRLLNRLKDNSLPGSRRNIAAHYDLGNEFFASFLDPSMTYSSGRYPAGTGDLDAAQTAKLDAICRLLDLRPGDRVLEIGTGWGSLAIHAAEQYDCRVTTTTISPAQFALAQQRIQDRGLSAQIELHQRDYRELTGRFDKLASIEMVEAVGDRHLETWFAQLGRLLHPQGREAIQAITIADQAYAQALRRIDFIKRHIFPGSFIPSSTRLLQAATAASDLRLRSFQDFGQDYARTLRAWRQNFDQARADHLDLGLDERFRRLWRYYLDYCAAGFAEGQLGVAHLLFERPWARVSEPDYLAEPSAKARTAAARSPRSATPASAPRSR